MPALDTLRASLVAQTVKNLPAMPRPGFDPWVEKIPWRRAWQPTAVSLPGESHGQRSLTGYIVQGVTRVGRHLVPKHPPPILKAEIYSLGQKS